MDLIEPLRAWLESFRAWILSRGELGWLHDWAANAPVQALWLIVLGLIVALVLLVGFWPPLKPLDDDEHNDANGAEPQA
jgi:hypothetical protein